MYKMWVGANLWVTLKYNSSCDDFKHKLINMDEKINSLLEDLVFYFEANNTGNVTNEFRNRCKQAQTQQLLLYSVVSSFKINEKVHTVYNDELCYIDAIGRDGCLYLHNPKDGDVTQYDVSEVIKF